MTGKISSESPISSITSGPRQSNIELLRILAMFLVLVVHADFWTLNPPTADDFVYSPLNAWTRTFFESVSIVCVNVFILISGWFGIKPSVKGLCGFIFQCAFFLIGIYIVLLALGQTSLTMKGIAGCFCLTPVNWFIKSYVGLYILAPVLNAFVEKASKKQFAGTIIAFYIFQTIWGCTGAATFIEEGYSTFSFIGLYLLARYIKLFDCQKPIKSGGVIYIISVVANTLLYFLQVKRIIPMPNIYSYINPLVILGALGLLMFFSRLNIPTNKVINWTAKSAFAVFLLHTNPGIGRPIFVPFMQYIYESYSGPLCLLAEFVALSGIFILAIILDQPRKYLWGKIYRSYYGS